MFVSSMRNLTKNRFHTYNLDMTPNETNLSMDSQWETEFYVLSSLLDEDYEEVNESRNYRVHSTENQRLTEFINHQDKQLTLKMAKPA